MPAILSFANISTAIIAVNFWAFAAFGIDKSHAENGRRRISEANLLALAFIGGTIGAYAGRSLFRHKTRKQPFNRELARIAGMQVLAVGAAYWWFYLR